MPVRRDTIAHHHLGHPPRVGPHARFGWDEAGGRWVIATTATGHALIDKFLAAYPVPLLSLRARSPGLFRVLQSLRLVNDRSDEHAEALYGLAVAATTFDDSIGVTFDTHAVWQIYSRVGSMRLNRRKRAARLPAVSLCDSTYRTRDGSEYSDMDPAAPPDADAHAETAAAAALALAALPAETALTLARKFGLNGHPDTCQRDRGRANGITRSAQGMRERNAARDARKFLEESGAA